MADGGRPRPNVWRREANFAVAVLGGVGGRLGSAEARGVREPDLGGEVAEIEGFRAGGFFLLVWKVRRIDHSDSNCTDSNSLESGEYSSKAESSIASILRSAKRIMKTRIGYKLR